MNIVINFEKAQLDTVSQFLESKNLTKKEIPHALSFKGSDVVINLYSTGKLMIQGKDNVIWETIIRNHFHLPNTSMENEVRNDEKLISTTVDVLKDLKYPRIGSDESGKGDFFGPLVTAAFLLPSKEIEIKLINLGVTDSKKINNKKILDLAEKIKKIAPYQIVKIGPDKYNDLYTKMNNVNKILGWSHARAIENVLLNSKVLCTLAVADKFGDESVIKKALFAMGKEIELIQTPKAERDVAVAAASILARASFLDSIKQLEGKANHTLPLGANERVINSAIEIVNNNDLHILKHFAKLHFRTYEEIKNRL